MRTPWRAALVVVAVVAAGCGNSTVGGDGSGGDRPKLPISSAGGPGGSAATVKSEMAADAAAGAAGSTEPAFAPIRPVEYRLADGAKAPATSATAYQLKKVEGVSADVAKALGVDPADVTNDTPYGDWWYSAEDPNTAVSSSVASCASDAPCEDIPAPPELEGVPLPDDAKAKVKAILGDLGIDVAADDLDVEGEDGSLRTVTYSPSVDGVPVPMLTTTITFGAHGRIQYANGFLYEVEEVGDYPLVSLADAFDRHQHGFGSGGVETMEAGKAVPMTAVDMPAPVDDPACAADGPDCGGAQPPPTEPTPVEPQIVEVTGARLVLEPVGTGCIDDPVYLVPAFELLVDGDPGAIGTVTAVTDDAIDTPDPREDVDQACPEDEVEVEDVPEGKPEPAPLPPDAGSTEPQPAPAPGSVEPQPARNP